MECNVGTADRVARIVFGLAILGGVYAMGLLGDIVGIILGLIGLIVLGTGITGFCATYKLLGINTCGAKKTTEEISTKKD